ncbi:MAG: hypothetical protein K6A14_00365 [Erysipelotrichaceae bacterium]|nr:hypothetical protein [Erysipelotrichaceae bacterium]
MIAYLLLAIVVLIIGIVIAVKRYADLKAFSLTLTVAITLAIIILAYPHFYLKYGDVLLALLSAIRYGPSAMSMNVDSTILDGLAMSESLAVIYKILLYSLYVAGPICASVVVISYSRLLTEWLLTLRYGTIHVFSSLEERAVCIAESIAAQQQKHLIVFCNSGKTSDESLKVRVRAIRGMLLNKKETQIHLRKNHRYEFYLFGQTSEQCLINATALCDDLLSEKNYEQKNVVVRIFIDRDSIEYIRKLDCAYGRKVYLRYADADSAIAIEALRKMKPWLVSREHLNLAFINVSGSSLEMIGHLVYLLTEPGSSAEMHVLDRRARELVSRMKMNSPEVLNNSAESYLQCADRRGRNYDISFHEIKDSDYSIIEALQQFAVPDVIVLSDDDDETNLRLMQQLKRYYASQSDELSWPRMAVKITSRQLNKVLQPEEGVIYYGNQAERYSYQNIVHPELERAAKRTHLVYLSGQYEDIMNLPEERQEQILEETGYYDYVNIDSSMANSLTLEYRYDYILAQQPDESLSERQRVEKWLADPANLKKIGDGEHERWNAYQRVQGWRLASRAQEEHIAIDTQGRKVKSNELMLHPALVSVADLPQAEKQADELLRKYDPQSGPTNYVELDRYFYRHILEILEK